MTTNNATVNCNEATEMFVTCPECDGTAVSYDEFCLKCWDQAQDYISSPENQKTEGLVKDVDSGTLQDWCNDNWEDFARYVGSIYTTCDCCQGEGVINRY